MVFQSPLWVENCFNPLCHFGFQLIDLIFSCNRLISSLRLWKGTAAGDGMLLGAVVLVNKTHQFICSRSYEKRKTGTDPLSELRGPHP